MKTSDVPNPDATPAKRRRHWAWLLLPPVIPLAVHAVTRYFMSADEVMMHGLFRVGGIMIGVGWAHSLLQRFERPLGRAVLIAGLISSAIVASGLLAPPIVDLFSAAP